MLLLESPRHKDKRKKNKIVRSSFAYTAVILSEDNIRRTSVFVLLLMLVLMFMLLLSPLAYACVSLYMLMSVASENQPLL